MQHKLHISFHNITSTIYAKTKVVMKEKNAEKRRFIKSFYFEFSARSACLSPKVLSMQIIVRNKIKMYKSNAHTEPTAIKAGPMKKVISATQITQQAALTKFLMLPLSRQKKKKQTKGSNKNAPQNKVSLTPSTVWKLPGWTIHPNAVNSSITPSLLGPRR